MVDGEIRWWIGLGFVGALVLLFAGCGDNDQRAQENLSGSQRSLTKGLVVPSNDDFERYLKSGIEQTNEQDFIGRDDDDTMVLEAPANSSIDGSVPDVSSTNLIVAGVDEADLIKTDGRYLYAVKPAVYSVNPLVDAGIVVEPRVLSASPAPYPLPDRKPPVIRISEIQSSPASSTPLLDLQVGDGSTMLRGLYLTSNDDNDDVLVAVGQAQPSWGWRDWISPWYWQSGKTRLWMYDVNEPAAPQKLQRFDIDGHLLASRRVGNFLYLVTRFTPKPPEYVVYPVDAAQRDNNRQILSSLSVDDLMPRVSVNDAAPRLLVKPEHCFVPDTARPDAGYPSIITISTIDLNTPGEIDSVCYGGSSDGFYATTKNLYFTKTEWVSATVLDDVALSTVNSNSQPYTVVHKFSLGKKVPVYQGSGQIKGRIQGNPAFMMGEVDDVLHVVTGTYRPSNREFVYRLTSLRQKDGRRELQAIAHLPNKQRPDPIGKPGEMLYASRFIGNRAYLVTFKKVDPLYVLDLSVADDPRIAGELEIPGFSSYLHPVSNNLLLGVGKDAKAAEDGEFAWYQGLKVSLFDVKDIAAPKALGAVSIGERGTETSLLYDHRAIAYLPPGDGRPYRFTIPVQVHKGGLLDAQPWSIADWDHTGLYLFEINKDSSNGSAKLSHTGTLLKAKRSDDRQSGVTTRNDRAVIQGPAVHYVYDGKVRSADWGAVIHD